MKRKTVALLVLGSLLAPSAALADEPEYETLAAELARLRTEVEGLSSRIDDVRDETRTKLRTIASQKTSLEAEIQRDELRQQQMQQSLEDVQRRVREAGALQRELKPAVLEAIDRIRTPVEAGIPFRVADRLAELDRMKKDLQDDVIAPSNAVSRLWVFVEDELRLARENGLQQQVIELSGEEMLADVARVGMLMMYFRTPDERYGYVRRKGAGWQYVFYTDPADSERVAQLFTSLEKRVRVGFFDLPNVLSLRDAPKAEVAK